jgi:hypothetical protein
VGGYLGLFLGFSFFGLIDLGELIVGQVIKYKQVCRLHKLSAGNWVFPVTLNLVVFGLLLVALKVAIFSENGIH